MPPDDGRPRRIRRRPDQRDRRHRFVMVPQRVLDMPKITASDMFAYVAARSFASKQRGGEVKCWPGAERIAEVFGQKERTVRESLLRFERHGILKRSRQFGRGTVLTFIDRDPASQAAEVTQRAAPVRATSCTTAGPHEPAAPRRNVSATNRRPTAGTSLTPGSDTNRRPHAVEPAPHRRTSTYNQELEPAYQSPPTPQGADSGFTDFWKAFPKKAGRERAEKVWKRLKPDAELQAKILKALEAHKASEQWQDTRYIKHAEGWLNGKRWNDELTPATARPDDWARTRDIGKHAEEGTGSQPWVYDPNDPKNQIEH